ncbi:PspC domain-containing protein [Metabacillus halosaccharovorans]|uniref:PspC domain-containing protein n=1 Tax=Metabacillus halosaccharovorans TaxID=930124 RepID=A0ABT3DM27_9BACI|nr:MULTISPECIES: PspC domain-containing protein [Metabacillus]MBU7594637.1 PspC domain-containing protein [Metabacillus halosaccharovorans]MCM3442994.1 PspC domain-containing protein [Metabacillus halosaccharovorans]MCV9888120.1 PspC domain-containing protein [Metabacillus halosaccharovorans]
MKKLTRSRQNKKLTGVLGGLSEYLGMDASLVRILFVIVLLFTGFFPMGIIYLISIFLIPEETDVM